MRAWDIEGFKSYTRFKVGHFGKKWIKLKKSLDFDPTGCWDHSRINRRLILRR